MKTIDKSFPIFLLCGILISEENYKLIRDEINQIKTVFWNNKNVVFHSRDIRKGNNEFQILFDLDIINTFYKVINSLVEKPLYTIVAASINKTALIKKIWKIRR